MLQVIKFDSLFLIFVLFTVTKKAAMLPTAFPAEHSVLTVVRRLRRVKERKKEKHKPIL